VSLVHLLLLLLPCQWTCQRLSAAPLLHLLLLHLGLLPAAAAEMPQMVPQLLQCRQLGGWYQGRLCCLRLWRRVLQTW
jgi:hypothetical protein